MPRTGTVQGLLLVAMTAGQKPRTGRPALTDNPEFLPRLYEALPALAAGDITVAEAAKRVGCSRRSLRRYADGYGPYGPRQ